MQHFFATLGCYLEKIILDNHLSLDSELDEFIKSLSGGEKQRLNILRAFLKQPKVLILDEPTSGLDPNQRAEIRDLIKSLQKDRIILFSSHILSEVEAICDRVLLLHQGKLVSDSPMKDIKDLEKFFKEKTS